jgi:hypothetical protein
LNDLRERVITYLQFVTHDLVQGDPPAALREIQRVADRLRRITAMTPAALDAALNDEDRAAKVRAEANRRITPTKRP